MQKKEKGWFLGAKRKSMKLWLSITLVPWPI